VLGRLLSLSAVCLPLFRPFWHGRPAVDVWLVAALAVGELAAGYIARLNTLYDTNVSRRTDLVDGFHQAGTATALGTVAAASLDGTPAVVYANIANGNGGAELAGDADLD